MVGCTIGSRGEAPGERIPVIKGDDNDDTDNGDNIITKTESFL
jgi:hypothetical protein